MPRARCYAPAAMALLRPPPASASWREWLGISAVVALALGLRLWHLAELAAHDPFYGLPSVDAGMYHDWASRIAEGDWLGEGVFHNGPLFPYFLGLCYALFGASHGVGLAAQALAGSLASALTWSLGRRLFSPAVALLAAAAVACCSTLIFYGGVLLVANALVLLFLVAARSAIAAVDRPSALRFGLAGLWVGLGALARPNLLGFGLLCAAWAGWALAPAPARRRALWLAAYAAGALLVIAPVTLRNYAVGGVFVPITYSGGMNLYLGNNADSDGSFRVPRWVPQSLADDTPEQRAVFARRAEAAVGRALSEAEVSSFWSGEARRFVWEQPSDWLRLQRRKLLLMSNRVELWNVRSLEITRSFSAVLRWPGVEFRWLAPLALAGLLLTAGRWRELIPLYAIPLTLFGTMFAFFVLSRYRAPMLPALALLAAAGLAELGRRLGRDARAGRRGVALWLAAVLLGGKIVALPAPAADLSVAYYNLGNRYLALEDWPRAVDSFQRALRGRPGYISAWNNLALALERRGGDEEQVRQIWQAIRAWGEANGQPRYVERAERHLAELEGRGAQEGGAADSR